MANKRDRRTARANARLRYNPEERALASLFRQAKGEYQTDLKVASGVADTAIRGARRARKPLAKVYARAQQTADTAHQDVEAALGRTGTGADTFKALTDRHFALAQQQRADTAAAERADLIAQENQARLGKAFARGAARTRFNETRAQLQAKRSDLRGERLDYTVTQLNELDESRRKIRAENAEQRREQKWKEKNIRLQAGETRKTQRQGARQREAAATRKEAADRTAAAKGEGRKPASRSEARMFRSDFSQALSYAREYANQGTAREAAQRTLLRGVASDRKAGQPAIPKVDDQLALQAALDMAYGGNVSKRTLRQLRALGLGGIPGIVTPRQARRRVERRALAQEQQYMSPKY